MNATYMITCDDLNTMMIAFEIRPGDYFQIVIQK